jgi:hypothetical protein
VVPASSTFTAAGKLVLKVSQWFLRPGSAAAFGHRCAGAGVLEFPGNSKQSAAAEFIGSGATVSSFTVALPNPSLERTSTGLALGPRTGQCHHPSRGPSANPAASAQLKR